MSSSASLQPERGAALPAPAGFVCAALGIALGAAVLAGWAPVRFSIVTVFLFAGPHNWLEARYFLTRLPARWGKLRAFFLVAFAGLAALTAAFAALPWLGRNFAAARSLTIRKTRSRLIVTSADCAVR